MNFPNGKIPKNFTGPEPEAEAELARQNEERVEREIKRLDAERAARERGEPPRKAARKTRR